MAFEKVDAKPDFPAMERDVLKFWEETRAFETLREKNRGGPKWSFLDGPITANNPMGVHHAWGRTYKDVFQRYHAAKGHDTRYQNGFDCQGLWIEVEVEKAHGFTSKKDIDAYGVGRFVEECKTRARKYAAIQSEQSKRLGYWMDWSNSYYTMSDGNNYAIWAFLKKCHDEGFIYKGEDVMPWCPRCGTGISQMEMNEGYRATEHLSVFVRFPLLERKGEALLVWTTTPWTLTSNVAAAVKPDMVYVKVRCGEWVYYVGKGNFEAARKQPVGDAGGAGPSLMSIQAIFKNAGGFEVLGTVRGEELVGLRYTGPFDHLDGAAVAREHHRVIAWDAVTETEGSGIVHIAPGCGSEDYHLGKSLGLPAIAPLEEDGRFRKEFGALTGQRFVDVGEGIAADLKTRQVLVAKERYLHRYPHCWRCKEELVYRLVDEWFIRMEWRDRIMDATRQASWIPEWGMERELDWLRNMGDWMISKKRYWGLALPIWECGECGHFDVVGSREELQSRAVGGWDRFDGNSPHRPWIDEVKIKCGQCGHGSVSRIKDVGNPWLDASIVPFSTMGYFEDRAYWEQWFPADFVVEALPGQFRNWFYAMLAVSAMLVNRSPFKTLLGHGLVLDDNMEEMHKSKGNAIEFNEAADSIGVDVMRWMYCRHSPERNLAFGPVHCDEIRNKMMRPLWNTYLFFCNYARLDGFDPARPPLPLDRRSDLDRWILSDLQGLIELADGAYARFEPHVFCLRAEKFIDDLSNWYVRRSRRRFWKSEWSDDKLAAYQSLYEVLTSLCQLIAPVVPFVTESMYQNLVRRQNHPSPASVHHLSFPTADASRVDRKLSERMNCLLRIVSMGRAARTVSKLKVRQPLAEMRVQCASDAERAAVEQFDDHLLEELNVKRVTIESDVAHECRASARANMKFVGPRHGKDAAAIDRAVRSSDALQIAGQLSRGEPCVVECNGRRIELAPDEVIIEKSYGDAWAAEENGGTIVLLDKRVTHELKLEGIARDIVRQVQNLRKDAGLNVEDRIRLSLQTDAAALREAIEFCGDHIARETLATSIVGESLPSADGATQVDVDGMSLSVALCRA
ncbi:MAG: isoleucine--tRNA ligase [Phycisphaerales bacterium]|nr:isoleucine--tRNA ligase [Phycisphaerales bacterium]